MSKQILFLAILNNLILTILIVLNILNKPALKKNLHLKGLIQLNLKN